MVDICKCDNINCLIRDKCYRFRATASEYQAYFIIDKTVNDEADCDSFWVVKDEEHFKKLEKNWADF